MSFFDELLTQLDPAKNADRIGAPDWFTEGVDSVNFEKQVNSKVGLPSSQYKPADNPPYPTGGPKPPGEFTGAANQPAVPVQDPNRQLYQPPQLPLHDEGFMKPVQPVRMRNSQMDDISKLLRGG
jgi:hypothetical protein